MARKTKYLLILLMAMMIDIASAQNSQVLYYMNLPQNHLLNPALRPSNSLYIGLPVISGINLNINNNILNFSDVIIKGQVSDSLVTFLHTDYNFDKFLAKIKDKNSFEPEASFQLFGLGFSAGKDMYIFLDINERIAGNVVFPGDLLKLALNGNEGFVGNKIDLSSFRADLKYYREFGLGFSKNFTNKLRIGVKGKLLFGIGGFSIDNKSFGINVNNDYSHILVSDMTLNISAPVKVTMGADNNIKDIVFDDSRFKTSDGIKDNLLNTKNMGFGLDIGATYNISEKIMVSAALTDLGFIKWKTDVTNLQAKGRFEFSGIDLSDFINGTKTMDELGTETLESLKDSIIISKSNDPFTTYLPFGVTLGGSYNISRRISIGLLSYSRFIGKQIRESLTLSANVNLGNSLSTSFSYSIANHQYDNLGAGLALRIGIFQFYMLADKIPVTWNNIKVDSNSTILLPTSWNTFNLRLGMNLAFGNRNKKKEDKPMLTVD
jgi:hypothetical protein